MKHISLLLLLLLGLPAMAQRSVLYDTSTYRLVLPTNILGMTFNGTLVTNMAGTGLTISSGVLQVNTGVMATLAAVAAGYQPLDATLTAVAGASTAANTLIYFTAADTASVATFTAFGRTLVDDTDASAARTTLGLAIGTNVQAWDADLDDLADGSLSGSKIGTGIDAGNITAGTLAEARIDAAIARVSALSSYALLTSSNNFTATNKFAAIDLGGTIRTTWPSGGSGGDVYTSSNNVFTGTNSFTVPVSAASLTVNDDAYDATSWNGSTNVPTKNAVRDKIESLSAAGTRYLLLRFGSASENPADAATRYIGALLVLSSRFSATHGPVVVPVDGTIIGYHISTFANAPGTSETVSLYLRLNDTTDFGGTTVAWDAQFVEATVSGLSQSVTAGDKLSVKMAQPTWATNPTGVLHQGWILMEVN